MFELIYFLSRISSFATPAGSCNLAAIIHIHASGKCSEYCIVCCAADHSVVIRRRHVYALRHSI